MSSSNEQKYNTSNYIKADLIPWSNSGTFSKHIIKHTRHEHASFLTATVGANQMMVFWMIIKCRIISLFWGLGVMCCLHFQGDWISLTQSPWRTRQHIPFKHQNKLIILCGVILEDHDLREMCRHCYIFPPNKHFRHPDFMVQQLVN